MRKTKMAAALMLALALLVVSVCAPVASTISTARANANAYIWPAFRGDAYNSGLTATPTPTNPATAMLAWSFDASSGAEWPIPSTPLVADHSVFVVGKSTLYQVHVKGLSDSYGAPGFIYDIPLTFDTGYSAFLAAGDGKVFVTVGDGQVEAIDIFTHDSLWVSPRPEGDVWAWSPESSITYANGYLYTGAYSGWGATEGIFYCIDASNGELVWTYSSDSSGDQKGFYWAGAVVTDSAVLFAGDDGMLVSHALTEAQVIDTVDLGASVKSPVLFVESDAADGSGVAYVATVAGDIARVPVAADGTFIVSEGRSASTPGGMPATSTPVRYRNRLYVVTGESDFWETSNGVIDVFDATTLEHLRSIPLPAYSQSSPLLSYAKANVVNGYEAQLYLLLNGESDDLICVTDSELPGATPSVATLFRPGKAYAAGSVIAGEVGTLYFMDGGGWLTAVGELDPEQQEPVLPPEGKPKVNPSNSVTPVAAKQKTAANVASGQQEEDTTVSDEPETSMEDTTTVDDTSADEKPEKTPRTTAPVEEKESDKRPLWLALVGGLLAGALVFAIVIALFNRSRARKLADEATANTAVTDETPESE